MPTAFRNRIEAGQLLAEQHTAYAGRPDVLVLTLPRGGVPVASEVARALGAPAEREKRATITKAEALGRCTAPACRGHCPL
jgi:hypothetical protein